MHLAGAPVGPCPRTKMGCTKMVQIHHGLRPQRPDTPESCRNLCHRRRFWPGSATSRGMDDSLPPKIEIQMKPWLVGGFNLPLRKMMEFVSWDDDIPN